MRSLSKQVKEAQGTLEPSREAKRKQSQSQSQDIITKMHSPREWPDEAKEIFLEIVGVIGKAGFLTKGAGLTIRALAFHEYHRRLCEEQLILNPADRKSFEMLTKNSGCIERLCTKLCLNPADVYRAPKPKEEDFYNPSGLLKLS